ncbi:MAG: 6-phosphogluconolactonase [Firmicutes bacterium]|nr:6-phosphogluconolactonase [Bacillota bacterium]
MTLSQVQVHVEDSPTDVVQSLAHQLWEWAHQDCEAHEFAAWALPGGHTPISLYERLAADQSRWPWPSLRLYLGDERRVPPTDPLNNFSMIRKHLLDRLRVPPAAVYPWPTLAAVPDCLASYRQYLSPLPREEGYPQLDVALLGMGDDGHTASVFPESPQYFAQGWVACGPGPQVDRLTLTLPLLRHARRVVFLITGAAKADRVRHCLTDAEALEPAALLTRQAKEVHWFLDRGSAQAL